MSNTESISKPLIFLVDDDPFYNKLLELNLNSENFNNIEIFNSGEDCLTNLSKSPDIIILDYEMDGINGLETLEQIKKFNKNIKVIFFSAQESPDVVEESIRLGANEYLQKSEYTYNKIKFLMKKMTNSIEE